MAGAGQEKLESYVAQSRRKELMTAMYQRAEAITGQKVAPTTDLSSLGQKLWLQKK